MAWLIRDLRRTAMLALALGTTACPEDTTPVETEGTDASTTTASQSTTIVDGSSSSGASSSDEGIDTTADDTTGDPPPPEVDPVPDPAGLAAGRHTSCRVEDDGTMTCWGNGGCGMLASDDSRARPPVAVATEQPWASVDMGWTHVCAIAQDRSLWCWGDGDDGKLGDGILDDGLPFELCRPTPVEVAPGTTWARLSLGRDHSCGVQTDGTLWCWGSNASAQIGDGAVGPLYNRLEPVEVGGTAWIDVYAGYEHSCGLESDGTTWCWGAGGNGQLGRPDVIFSSVPLEVPGLPPLQALATGGSASTTCGVDQDGTSWCWGANAFGTAGQGTSDPVLTAAAVQLPAPVVEIHNGSSTTCARDEDGHLWCWGLGSNGQLGDDQTGQGHTSSTPLPIAGEGWIDLAIGFEQVCSRNEAETTWCWGGNGAGQVGDGTSGPDNGRLQPAEVGPWGGGPVATDWVTGAIGGTHGCGIRQDDSLWCWGNRYRHQLGNADPLDDCSPANPSECGVTTPLPTTPAGAAAWVEVVAGEAHTCARQGDGTLWCWGRNEAGQLGHLGDDTVPSQVGVQTDWTMARAGSSWTCGLRDPGTLWCWGSNSAGQLGQGMEGGSEPAPIQVGPDADWTAIALGSGEHACGLRSGGNLWCWGRNDFGQLGLGMVGAPVATPTMIPGTWSSVATGSRHTCAIASDGTLWCWGDPIDGGIPVDVPTQVGLDGDWVQVTAGGAVTCGRRSDGTTWCWGSNANGALGSGEVGVELGFDVPMQVGTETDWTDLMARNHTICGRRGSTLWCWGSNLYGQQGNDTIFTEGTAREVRNDG